MRARLARYALFQTRDYIVERGIPAFLIGIVMLFPLLLALIGMDTAGVPADAVRDALTAILPIYGFIAVLIAVNGIISHDRQRGYFRLLFAKPLSPTRYYLQAFALHGIGTVVVTAALVLLLVALSGEAFSWGVLTYVGLYYISAGSVGLLLSAITRFDWIALAVVWWLAQLLRSMSSLLGGWYFDVLHVLLPPAHLLSELAGALVSGAPVAASSLAWIGGYGVIAVLLALVALRVRPLAP